MKRFSVFASDGDGLSLHFPSTRAEDDYSEEEEEEEDDEDDEEVEEYDGEIPQPELEPRSRRCLVGDAGVCIIPGENSSEEEEEENEEDEDDEHNVHGEDSDSDGPVLYKDEDSDEDEEDEPPPSKTQLFHFLCRRRHGVSCVAGIFMICVRSPCRVQAPWPAG